MSDQGAWTQLSNCKKNNTCCTGSVPGATVRCMPIHQTLGDVSWHLKGSIAGCHGANVLEMVFYKAFESLPPASQKLFYSTPHPSNTGTGLHAIPLLLQGPRLNPAQKTVWNIPISKSADLGIRRWLEVKARESKRGEWYELLICEDYAKLWHELDPKI